jgi:hypothetical protein
VLSPALANLTLLNFECTLSDSKDQMFIFVDDFILVKNCHSNTQSVMDKVKKFLFIRGCALNEEKTKSTMLTQDKGWFDFAGIRFGIKKGKVYSTIGRGQSRAFTFMENLSFFFNEAKSKVRKQTKFEWRESITKNLNSKIRGHLNYFKSTTRNKSYRIDLHEAIKCGIRRLAKRLRTKAKLFYFYKGRSRIIRPTEKRWYKHVQFVKNSKFADKILMPAVKVEMKERIRHK